MDNIQSLEIQLAQKRQKVSLHLQSLYHLRLVQMDNTKTKPNKLLAKIVLLVAHAHHLQKTNAQ